jgi:hypothetical protein
MNRDDAHGRSEESEVMESFNSLSANFTGMVMLAT